MPPVWHTDDTDKMDLHNLLLNPDSAEQKSSVVIRVIRVLKSRTKLLPHKSATQGTVIRITNAGNIKEIRNKNGTIEKF